jgi:TIP41-like family
LPERRIFFSTRSALSMECLPFQHRGWSFSSVSGSIGARADLEKLARNLVISTSSSHGSDGGREGACSEFKAPLPEQTFSSNYLLVRHEKSGFTLRFDAAGALREWHKAQTSKYGGAEGKEISAVNFDWTFAEGGYDGNLLIDKGTSASAEPCEAGATPQLERPSARQSATLRTTLCSDSDPSGGLPMDLLTRRDPFLFFSSFVLYADDLHDKGVVECSVKIRVMESVFLVLLRTYLRIDADRVFLRDLRYCHVFGSNKDSASASAPFAKPCGVTTASAHVATIAPWAQNPGSYPPVSDSARVGVEEADHFVLLKNLQVREISAATARQLLGLPPLKSRDELLSEAHITLSGPEGPSAMQHAGSDLLMREITADDIHSAVATPQRNETWKIYVE